MWTYDGDPTGDRKDEVRFLVGDTNQNAPLVQDEEISYILTLYPPADQKPAWLAAAQVCDSIAASLARKVQQSIGPLNAANQMQFDHYVALAQQLRVLYATDGKGVIHGSMGGIRPAAPILSGGGGTLLGGTQFENWDNGGGV